MTQQEKADARQIPGVDEGGPWGTLFAIGVIAYVIVGAIWADSHPDDRNSLIGFDLLDFGSQIALWPLHALGVLPL